MLGSGGARLWPTCFGIKQICAGFSLPTHVLVTRSRSALLRASDFFQPWPSAERSIARSGSLIYENAAWVGFGFGRVGRGVFECRTVSDGAQRYPRTYNEIQRYPTIPDDTYPTISNGIQRYPLICNCIRQYPTFQLYQVISNGIRHHPAIANEIYNLLRFDGGQRPHERSCNAGDVGQFWAKVEENTFHDEERKEMGCWALLGSS